MTKFLKYLLILPVALAAVSACSKYDSPENVHITAYGTAVRYNGDGAADYYLIQDDGATLYIKNLLWDYEFYRSGQRVKFNYEIMGEPDETRAAASGETHDITLYYILGIPEQETVPLSFIMDADEATMRHRQDSIGNDPLCEITRMFFSGRYVNMEYAYRGAADGTDPTNVSMVVDDLRMEEGTVVIHIHHNAPDEVPAGSGSGLVRKETEVSFRIEELIPAGEDSIRIMFSWREYRNGEEVAMAATCIYSLDADPNRPIVGTYY